jgi:hypothetical protein
MLPYNSIHLLQLFEAVFGLDVTVTTGSGAMVKVVVAVPGQTSVKKYVIVYVPAVLFLGFTTPVIESIDNPPGLAKYLPPAIAPFKLGVSVFPFLQTVEEG